MSLKIVVLATLITAASANAEITHQCIQQNIDGSLNSKAVSYEVTQVNQNQIKIRTIGSFNQLEGILTHTEGGFVANGSEQKRYSGTIATPEVKPGTIALQSKITAYLSNPIAGGYLIREYNLSPLYNLTGESTAYLYFKCN